MFAKSVAGANPGFFERGWGVGGEGGERKCVSCCDLLLKVVGHSTPESSEK